MVISRASAYSLTTSSPARCADYIGPHTYVRILGTGVSPAAKRTGVGVEALESSQQSSPRTLHGFPSPLAILRSQFISEGLAAVLVLIAAQPSTASDTADMLRLASFFMLLFPVFIPVMQKAYDGVFVNVRTTRPWSCVPVLVNAWMWIRPSLTTRPQSSLRSWF